MTLKTRARAALARHGIAATITGFAAMAIFAAATVGAYRFGYQAGGQLFGRIAVGFLLISGILVYLTAEVTPADPEPEPEPAPPLSPAPRPRPRPTYGRSNLVVRGDTLRTTPAPED